MLRTRIKWNGLFSVFSRRGIFLCSALSIKNHYEVLGVPKNASKRDIKTAFVGLCKAHHPDVSINRGINSDNNTSFNEINDAYSTLIDPVKRSMYDHELSTITTYMNKHKYYQYAGSHGYSDIANSKWPFTAEHYSSSNSGFKHHYHGDFPGGINSRIYTKRDHARVVGYLVLLTILVTGFHSFRINHTHKEFQRASEEESRRNHEIYKGVRERAKSRSLREQLETLTHKHSEGLSKLSEKNKP